MARRNTTASKKAAELSAGFAAREEELQNLAVEFFDLEEKSDYGKIQKRIQDYQQKLKELQKLIWDRLIRELEEKYGADLPLNNL